MVSAFHTPFIQDDIETLEKHYTVRTKIGHGILQIVKIVFSVVSADVIVCWFASVYSSIAVVVGRLLGVRSMIIVGGVDLAKEKELRYGLWLSPWKSKLVRYALRHADCILAVDPSLKKEACLRAEYDGDNISYVPTGYESTFWKPAGAKELLILTVAVVNDQRRLKIKGIDILIETARKLQHHSFIVIGILPEIVARLNAPSNVTFLPMMKRDDLLPYYQKAKVYCQPSLREGLPNTLCEAMLCGCLPVATKVGGNPSAVGDVGILVPPKDSDALAAAIEHAMNMTEEHAQHARARIVSLFPRQKREQELVRIINGLVQ
jgi:glycosyltransferase involved in cell wall biosynthesis